MKKISYILSCLIYIIISHSVVLAYGKNIQLRITNHVPGEIEFIYLRNTCATKYPTSLVPPGHGHVFHTDKGAFEYKNCGIKAGGVVYGVKDDLDSTITIVFREPGSPLSKESVVCKSGKKYRLWNCAGIFGGYGRSSIELK